MNNQGDGTLSCCISFIVVLRLRIEPSDWVPVPPFHRMFPALSHISKDKWFSHLPLHCLLVAICPHYVSPCSVTVVAAYLLARHAVTVDEALARIRACRPEASPNEGFLRQLAAWHALMCRKRSQGVSDLVHWLQGKEAREEVESWEREGKGRGSKEGEWTSDEKVAA